MDKTVFKITITPTLIFFFF